MRREMRRSGSHVNYTQRNYIQGNYHKEEYNSKKQYSNSASGYYMHTANAVAPDYLYEEDLQPAVRKIRKPKKKNTSALAQHISTVFVVFLLGIILVGQYAYIQNLGYQVSQTKSELKSIQDQNEKTKKQIASMGELQKVEITAVNNMGMHKPEQGEVIYLPKKSAAEQQPAKEQGQADDADGKVKEFFGTVLH